MCYSTLSNPIFGLSNIQEKGGSRWGGDQKHDKLTKGCNQTESILRPNRLLQKICKGYGEIAAPLTKLLQKNAFKRGGEATAAFESLKLAMTTIMVLALPDWSLPFTIETDASDIGLGAVISQNGHPIAFFSQKLSPRAQTKSIYERELISVMLSGQKWRDYLLGRKFTIILD